MKLTAGRKLFIAVSNLVPFEFLSAAVQSAQEWGWIPYFYRGLEYLAAGSAAGLRRELYEAMEQAAHFVLVSATTEQRDAIEHVPLLTQDQLAGKPGTICCVPAATDGRRMITCDSLPQQVTAHFVKSSSEMQSVLEAVLRREDTSSS